MYLVVALVVGFAVGFLVNRYLFAPPKVPETLVVATWGAQWGEATARIAENFTKLYGNPVQLELHAGASGVVIPKIANAWPEVKIDVVFVSPGVCYQLADAGYLVPLKREEIPVIDEIKTPLMIHYPDATDPNDPIYGLGIYQTGGAMVAWRPSIVDKILGPNVTINKWSQLLDPRLKGKIMIPYMGMGVGGILVTTAYQFGGDESNPEPGWTHLKELAETGNIGAVWTTEADAMRLFSTGETPVAFIFNQWHMFPLAKEGLDIKWVPYLEDTPEKVVPVTADVVAIVNGPRQEIAKKFVNFFLQAQNNEYYNKMVGAPPSNKNARIDPALEPWTLSTDVVENYGRFPDVATRAKKIDEWTTRWDTEIAPLIGK